MQTAHKTKCLLGPCESVEKRSSQGLSDASHQEGEAYGGGHGCTQNNISWDGPLLSVSLKRSILLCRDLEANFAYLLVLFSLFQTYFQTLKLHAFLLVSCYIVSHFIMEGLRGYSKNSSSRYYDLQGKANSLCVVAKSKRLASKYEYNSPKHRQTNSYGYRYSHIHGCWTAAELAETMGTLLDRLMGWVWMRCVTWGKTQCKLWIFWCAMESMMDICFGGTLYGRQCLRSPLAAHHHTAIPVPQRRILSKISRDLL